MYALLAIALAAATSGAARPPAPRHIDVDEADVVDGDVARAEGEALLARKKARFGSLLKLREDFDRELVRSGE